MNPYTPPTPPRELTKEERRQRIISHPDAGPLSIWTAKHPTATKVILLVIASMIIAVAGMMILLFSSLR